MTNAIGPRDMTRIAKALEDIRRELRRMQEPDCRTHGKWVDWLGSGNEWECSVCKCSIESHGSIAYKFCPMCGADMRGEKE